jgi:uncharacterized membrane protein YhdT
MVYLWDIQALVRDLRTNTVPTWQIRLYYILSPLLSLLNGLFFALLLFGHQLVEYSFQGWLKKQHPDINFYNYWAWGLTLLTVLSAVLGFYLCYRANQKGDGKNFWQRMACLSFPINFHITIYTIAGLGILGFVAYFFFQAKIMAFKQSVWPSDETVKAVVDTVAGNNPVADVAVKATKKGPGILSTLLKSPISVITAPLIPMRIKGFLKNMRAIALMSYPVLSLLPAVLSFLHYMLIRKMIKLVAQSNNENQNHN